MTIQDIKKALEFCAQDNYYFCGGCSYDDVRNCNDKLKIDALNVIIEQEREIERLKNANSELTDNLVFYKDKSYKLERSVDKLKTEIEQEIKQTKIDVLNKVKKFARRSLDCQNEYAVDVDYIDELIKEVQNGKDKG